VERGRASDECRPLHENVELTYGANELALRLMINKASLNSLYLGHCYDARIRVSGERSVWVVRLSPNGL
jgi:hypothetical protein